MRWLPLIILLVGCTPATAPPSGRVPTDGTTEAAAALAGLAADKHVAPKAPQNPGDPCENCKGTGKVGDGTVMVPCKPCKGTGKVLGPDQPKAGPVAHPRDIASEPTAALLREFRVWQHNDEPRTEHIQAIYEELLRRGAVERPGDYGGRRRIGRRR